jgi:hypothetical protein
MKSNKVKEKWFIFMMVLLMIIGNDFAYSQNSETDFKAEVTKDGTGVVILQYIGKSTTVQVPATIQGMPVREIGSNAFPIYEYGYMFSPAKGLPITSVVLPEGVKIIRESAFSYTRNDGFIQGMAALTAVTLPKGLTTIERRAFSGCSSLASINIPDSVISIGEEVFSSCSSLTYITIPNSITSIGDEVFMYCSSLTSIAIPNSVTKIGKFAFFGCKALLSINIPNNVISIGGGAFARTGIISITWPSKILSIESVFWYGGSSVYGESLGMFEDCKNLQTVIIPNGITSIGTNAFRGCTALTSVILPSTIQNISGGVFEKCSSLIQITVPESVKSISFSSSTFVGCSGLSLASQAVLRRLGYSGGF